MSAVNTDLSRFAVFVNSKSAVYPSTTKSDVVIPFTANLADHDPLKVMKVSITDVLFSNIFYNIRPNVNKLKIADVFAAGRNLPANIAIHTCTLDYGFYNYDSFTDWCNSGGQGESNPGIGYYATQTANATNFTAFFGFGSKYAGVTSNNVEASAYSLTTAKVWAQTPSLGDMYQPFLSDSSVTVTGSYSMIYAGKYLIVDEETYPLMHLLGFSNRDIAEASPIPGFTDYKGIGYPIYSKVVGGATQYSFDGVQYGTSSANTTFKQILPAAVSDFTGLDDLYIHCEQLRTQFMSSQGRAPLAPNDVVCVVPINVAYGDKMSFVPNFPLESYLLNTNITYLRFRMTNSNNEELDFKGINWSLTMYCEEVDDEARIAAENGPPGNLPQTFFTNGINQTDMFMQNRMKQAANKRRLNL